MCAYHSGILSKNSQKKVLSEMLIIHSFQRIQEMVFEKGNSSFLLELISHLQNSSSIKNSLLLIFVEFQKQPADLH